MEPTRRGMLAAVGVAGASGLAGCAGIGASGAATDAGDGTTLLAYVRVVNNDEVEHTVHLLVERSGEPVHWSSHKLKNRAADGKSRERIAGSWTETPSTYTIYARLDDATEWQKFDIGEEGVTCYGVEARVDSDAGLSLWFKQTPNECDDLEDSTKTATTRK
jgi:hypothetical protein